MIWYFVDKFIVFLMSLIVFNGERYRRHRSVDSHFLAMAKAIPTTCTDIFSKGLKGYHSNVVFFIVQVE